MNHADTWSRRIPRQAGLHLTVTILAYLGALSVRFEGRVHEPYWTAFWWFLLPMTAAALLIPALLGVYEGRPRAGRIAVAGLLTLAVGVVLAWGPRDVPLTVAVVGSVVSSLGLGAIRFLVR